MAGAGSVAGSVVRSGGLFSRLLKFKFAYYFIIILFIQAVAVGINSGGGFGGVVNALGERFFNVTQELHITSLNIIENGAIFNGWWDFIINVWSLVSNIWLIYLWLKLFSFLWGMYNDSQKLLSYFLSILTFLVLQVFYLFVFGTPIEGQTNYDLLISPIVSIRDFFRAIILLFSSFGFEKAIDSASNITNLNICTNSSGCVI